MTKLYLDEDVHKKIALSLRIKGYDVVSAHEVKNQGLPDYRQLHMPYLNKELSLHLMLVILIDCIKNIWRAGKNILAYSFQNKCHSAKPLNA